MIFSDRLGVTSTPPVIINAITPEIRTGIWNSFYTVVLDQFTQNYVKPVYDSEDLERLIKSIWGLHLKERIDEICNFNTYVVKDKLHNHIMTTDWYNVYNFVEFVLDFLSKNFPPFCQLFTSSCNKYLERNCSGYRILENFVVPISNDTELKEIDEAINNELYSNAGIHLKTAIGKLSDKVSPDFRNSIKESITAVENICRELTGESTLGKSITVMEKAGVGLNSQFKTALEKLYGYSNDKKTGIRHALMEDSETPGFDEAKFMLVICSSLVNYLISKGRILKVSNP
jgi:hypothetical protein